MKNGSSASIVTIQGEIDVPKLLPRNGPTEIFDCARPTFAASLSAKRTRHVFPFLDVASAPIVHENHAENVLARVGHRDRVAESRCGAADKKRHLKLEIEQLASAERRRRLFVGGAHLAVWPSNRRSGNDDARCAAVISDRHMNPTRFVSKFLLENKHFCCFFLQQTSCKSLDRRRALCARVKIKYVL